MLIFFVLKILLELLRFFKDPHNSNLIVFQVIEKMEILISATDSKIKSFSSELSSYSLVYFDSARFSTFLHLAMMAALRSTQIWPKKLKLYSF